MRLFLCIIFAGCAVEPPPQAPPKDCVVSTECAFISPCPLCWKCHERGGITYTCLEAPTDSGSDGDDIQKAPVATFPSCVDLPKTCQGSSDRGDCCDSPTTPGGMFFRSYDGTADYPNKTFPATVAEFKLDKYEVTVGRFRRFVNAVVAGWRPARGEGSNPRIAGSGWADDGRLWPFDPNLAANLKCDPKYQTWTDAAGDGDTKPINCVNWYEAFAFCAWDAGRLPTEAEWNYAAAGGAEQRAYPWSVPASSPAIAEDNAVYCFGFPQTPWNCSPQPVGSRSRGDGLWRHVDLAGNVWEWVLDNYGTYPVPCVNCANLVPAPARSLRGGNFSASPAVLRVSARQSAPPTTRDNSSGFRCARSP